MAFRGQCVGLGPKECYNAAADKSELCLRCQINKLQQQLAALTEKHRWIPVGERLPGVKEKDAKIQVANFKTKRVFQWTWFNSIGQINGLKAHHTHWRPIDLPDTQNDKEPQDENV